jgi:aspartate kinase
MVKAKRIMDQKVQVLKIGGGILKDSSSFEKVVNIVKEKQSSGKELVLVLSALYGVTDFLIDTSKKSLNGEAKIDDLIHKLKEMHLKYINEISDEKIKESAIFELEEKISVLEKFLFGVNYLNELSPRSKDMIQSYGERLSPIVLEAFLKDAGINAKFIDANNAGIIVKGNFEKSYVDINKTTKNFEKNVMPLLSKEVVLLPGYYGIDENEDVKTFGRGGTDYSAGFIASILEAKLEIWKDVSGFMTADPRVVEKAKQIEYLSYEEAEELGYLGAKILHPRTMDPLRKKELCAEIKNVFDPKVKGTIIGPEQKKCAEIIKSIAASKEISVITVQSSIMVNSAGFSSKIFSLLDDAKVPIDLIATSETSISFSINKDKTKKALEALKQLDSNLEVNITTEENLALVGVVGHCMRHQKGLAGRLFSVLGKNDINIELISQGASELNITFVVEEKDLEKTIKAIHKEFIE